MYCCPSFTRKASREASSCWSKLVHPRSFATVKQCHRNNILYITDIEGDYEYWERFLNFSSVLRRNSDESLDLADGYQFVYGGDICDRGYGDLRILMDLIKLKEKHQDRVHFVLGNRDINKLRLPFALHPSVISKYPKCYWLRSPNFYEQAKREVVLNSPSSKLEWVLGRTMGAPLAYSCRRKELEALQHDKNEIVGDMDIVKSYLDSLSTKYVDQKVPNDATDSPYTSVLLKYLAYGKIAVMLADNLFVHGAIDDFNMGWLPPTSSSGKGSRAFSIHEWCDEINKFASHEIRNFINNSESYLLTSEESANPQATSEWLWETSGGYGHDQPGSALLQYGMGSFADGTRNPSVIYATYLRNGISAPPSDRVMAWLQRGGVNRIIVGHQPNGDCPWLINKLDHRGSHVKRFQVLCADNGYARNVQYSKSNINRVVGTDTTFSLKEEEERCTFSTYDSITGNQYNGTSSRGGNTVSEVVIEDAVGGASEVGIRGVLSTGWNYSFSSKNKASMVGCRVAENWYVKSDSITIPDIEGRYALLAKSEAGFNFKALLIDCEHLVKVF